MSAGTVVLGLVLLVIVSLIVGSMVRKAAAGQSVTCNCGCGSAKGARSKKGVSDAAMGEGSTDAGSACSGSCASCNATAALIREMQKASSACN